MSILLPFAANKCAGRNGGSANVKNNVISYCINYVYHAVLQEN